MTQRKKLTGSAEIDWTSPFSKGLVFAVFTAEAGPAFYPRDLVSGKIPTDLSANTRSIDTEINRYLRTEGTTDGGLDYGRTGMDDLTSATGFTYICRFRSFVGARAVDIFDTGENATGDGFRVIYYDASRALNTFGMSSDNSNASITDAWDELGSNSEDRFHTIAARHKGAATVADLFINGNAVTATTSMTVSANANRTTRLLAWRGASGTSDMAIDWVLAFEGELTDVAIRKLSLNPNLVLKSSAKLLPGDSNQEITSGAVIRNRWAEGRRY